MPARGEGDTVGCKVSGTVQGSSYIRFSHRGGFKASRHVAPQAITVTVHNGQFRVVLPPSDVVGTYEVRMTGGVKIAGVFVPDVASARWEDLLEKASG